MISQEEFDEAFDRAIDDECGYSGYPVSDWFRSGVSRPEVAIANYRKLGPRTVANFTEWYEGSGYRVWHDPKGRPAVELEMGVAFGSVPVVMYVDAVLEDKWTDLLVLDLKTGGKQPESAQQLGLYACGIELSYGRPYRPVRGAYFMSRGMGKSKDIFISDYIDLSLPRYSVEFYTEQFEAMKANIATEKYVARVGKHCNMCSVADMCAAVGGEFSAVYDPSHPGYIKL